ncbi:MAG: undecaprenyl-diphosphate phosphatase [Candidatus Nitrohelix vancouverensis]|uniref:Undecaprenyl-diphosphatase n=1 Tax=Candidatus Nitrohelix vancouverensis TaxID=2705534 RepID=A0A7T0C378_9BACT|nr:MAG: undecaprenyl-diphosphate phosphatase [Candidatus Nitrohelix vancouverensis]
MDSLEIIILATLQGLTEFLPVSSSGHLIIAPHLFGFSDQGLAMDAILHLGTLAAIFVYFRKDIIELALSLLGRGNDPRSRKLAINILIATFPAGLVGLAGEDWIEANLRSTQFVALNMIFWSGIFLWADKRSKNAQGAQDDPFNLTLSVVLIIGLAQAIALLPGTSRSGITICAGLFCAMTPQAAARFSFLLGSPIILAAGLHKLLQVSPQSETLWAQPEQLLLGLGVSFLVGVCAIKLLFEVVAKFGLLPFIVYRLALALLLLIWFV